MGPHTLQPGQQVDRYTVEAVLGQGAMATVYRVRHAELHTPHALKVLILATRSLQNRALQEGRIQAGLRHPNVVAVTDVVRVEGAPALVMEYVSGPNLETLLAHYRPSLAQVDDLAMGIIQGMAAVHAAGMVHRDLKPANILVALGGDRPIPRIADFGLAKILHGDTAGQMTATRTGTTMGTPAYMAPEQYRNARDVDAQADVFAVGAVLYELLTGVLAFPGGDLIACFHSAAGGSYRPVQELVPAAPERMIRAIEGALQADPANRIQGCAQMLHIWKGEAEGASWAPVASGPPWEPTHLARLDALSSQPQADRGSDGEVIAHTLDWRPEGQPPQPDPGPQETWAGAPEAEAEAIMDVALGTDSQGPPEPSAQARPLSVLLVAAGLGMLVLVLGLLGLAGAWLYQGSPAAPSPTAVAPEAPPEAAGPAQPEASASPAAPPDAQSPPEARVAPASPGPSVAPEPEAAPAPDAGPPPEAAPEAEGRVEPPSAPSKAATRAPPWVEVLGVDRAYLIDAHGTRHPPGTLPAGTYSLSVFFDDGNPTPVLDLTLGPTSTHTVRCEPTMRMCR